MGATKPFEKWVRRKDNFERGCKLLAQLEDDRAENPEKWFEVTVALAAIDKAITPDDGEEEEEEEEGEEEKGKSMFDVWRRWTIDKHAFVDVRLSADEEATLSRALKENADEANGMVVLPTLRYVKPSKPHNRSVLPKPLSADQLAQNKIFATRCKTEWAAAQREMRARLGKYLASSLREDPREEDRGRTRGAALRAIGVAQLARWVEEDVDAATRKKREDELEREDQAKLTHAAFVKKKKTTAVRMSATDADKPAPAPPRFDLSTGSRDPKASTFSGASTRGAAVRPRYSRAATTTVELLRGQGMRVVHALDRGSRGLEGDLERCRRKLLESGYVHPHNFDDPRKVDPGKEEFDASKFDDVARRYVRTRRARQLERREDAKHEFSKWTAAKKGRDDALKFLSVLDPPALVTARDGVAAGIAHWRRVGALLKAVDGSLLHEWIAWSSQPESRQAAGPKAAWAAGETTSSSTTGICFEWAPAGGSGITPAGAATCWCAFAPRGCDIHRSLSCGGVSPIRAVLLRILKSGIDFTVPFDRLEKWLAKQKADDDRENEGPWVGSHELRKCLRDGGLALSKEEARLVVDAVDNYAGNGRARLSELKELLAKPVRAGDVTKVLRGLSYHEQTCPETGMPNAHRVTANPQKTKAGKHEVDVVLRNGEVRRRWTNPDLEKRRLVLRKLGVRIPHKLEDELSDGEYHDQRYDDDDDDDDGYDDDFEQQQDDQRRKSSPKRQRRVPTKALAFDKSVYSDWFEDGAPPMAQSEMALWGIWGSPRRSALRALRKISTSGLREERLREALSEGSPPEAPELWSASVTELEAEGVSARELTTRLVVRWRPNAAENAAPVAFFHLEFSGALGSKAQRENHFAEIACDPPSAQHDAFAFQHVVSGLEPNTTYVFRMRAFNAFGPGPYAWKRLTTPAEQPMQPVPVRLGPHGVVLRWKIPEVLDKRAAELRRSFDEAADGDVAAQQLATILRGGGDDDDDDGTHNFTPDRAEVLVRRRRWLELLDEKYRTLLDFLRRARTSPAAQQHLGDRSGGTRLTLLDELEESDAELVSWHWVRLRLAATSEIAGPAVDGGASSTIDAPGLVSTGEGARMVSDALERYEQGLAPGPDASGEVQRFQQIAAPTTYVVERCRSERHGEYEEMLRTRFGEATVNGLAANASYRFRVRAVTTDGDASPPSKSVVVNTLLETPAAPQLALVAPKPLSKKKAAQQPGSDGVGGGLVHKYVVSSTSVKLAWPRHGAFASGSDRRAESARQADAILARWTNAASDDDGAVSLEAVLAKFDERDALSLDQLPVILTRLGAHRTHAATGATMRAVWDELRDAARDLVRTRDFASWWNSDAVAHVIQRDRGCAKGGDRATTTRGGGVVASYRGRGRAAEIRGLRPNTVYRFTLRLVSPRSHSRSSQPLEVWTAPASPTPPRVVRVEPKAVVLKWYPGPAGSHKYVLESRLVEALDEVAPRARDYFQVAKHLAVGGSVSRAKPRSHDRVSGAEWKVAYEGRDHTVRVAELEPRAVYRFRVRALNGAGHASAPSELVQTTTCDHDPPPLVPRKAADQFTCDCADDDVVVGDTILFTERLRVDRAANRLAGEPARGGITQGAAAATTFSRRHASKRPASQHQHKQHHVGDRTVAGRVLAEAFYPSARTKRESRDLRIQVVWCTTSTTQAADFQLRPGEVIQRDATHVTHFQVFRVPWDDETHRRTYAEEQATLPRTRQREF